MEAVMDAKLAQLNATMEARMEAMEATMKAEFSKLRSEIQGQPSEAHMMNSMKASLDRVHDYNVKNTATLERMEGAIQLKNNITERLFDWPVRTIVELSSLNDKIEENGQFKSTLVSVN